MIGCGVISHAGGAIVKAAVAVAKVNLVLAAAVKALVVVANLVAVAKALAAVANLNVVAKALVAVANPVIMKAVNIAIKDMVTGLRIVGAIAVVVPKLECLKSNDKHLIPKATLLGFFNILSGLFTKKSAFKNT
ncbi:hypothetical protein [Bacillus sp. JJ722]|uniref:hypothetical protein n=1 Tax=Bacillus sp. JJ722 TaxID=3122973 RepID=UPI002FFDE0E6